MSITKINYTMLNAVKVLRHEGVLTFTIKSLQRLQKKHNAFRSLQKYPIHTKATYDDIINADFINKKSALWVGTNKKSLHFGWIMPPPGKGSGGHLNIFRFIEFLEKNGHTCSIYLYAQGKDKPSIRTIESSMGDSYPKLSAKIKWIQNANDIKVVDALFATSWETAYPVFNYAGIIKRFYFIQDFEPYFYPVGGLYSLAENTYRFGFYGVTAGNWLATKLKRDYGMSTDHFDFGADPGLYSYQNHNKRKEILCYVRPYTERRGFEVAILALSLFYKKHPEYTINLAGWDVSEYDIPFPYVNLKTLELEELDALYNNCAAGLVLSFTNMSLLPMELLKSGVIPVVNDGENNRLVSSNKYIAYCSQDPLSIANKLSEVVQINNLNEYASRAAASIDIDGWAESGKKFVSIIEREMEKNG